MFGDATDPEFIAHMPLRGISWAVSAVPEHDTGITHDDPKKSLMQSLRDVDFQGHIAVAVHGEAAAEKMRELGADLVLMPFRDAASHAAAMILTGAPPARLETSDPEGQKEFVS